MSSAQIIVAGGGLTGCIAACLMFDQGLDVLIVDQMGKVMEGASRWNEGKLHLGYTYVGTDDVRTAALMLAGISKFNPLLECVTGRSFEEECFTRPITYLVDRASLFSAEVLWDRTQKVQRLVEKTAENYPPLAQALRDSPLKRIDPEAASQSTQQENVVAAWTTPEHAMSTRVLADYVATAVAERGIKVVKDVVAQVTNTSVGWSVGLSSGERLTAPCFVNALWESRKSVDDTHFKDDSPVSIRWKTAIFASNQSRILEVAPSTRILGGYGDVTPYGNGDVYLSWYPHNMIAKSDTGSAPPVPAFDADHMMQRTLDGLGLPQSILESPDPEKWVRGGYVVARGAGDIHTTTSVLHDRSAAFAIERAPGYISVDAGKLTTAPMFAEKAAKFAINRLKLGAQT